MKVCVLGALGFVGRAFTRRLLDDGHEVTAVDNMSSGQYPNEWAFRPKDTTVRESDGALQIARLKLLYVDAETYLRSTPLDEFDLIIHLAAVVGGRLKIENDPLAVATDLAIDATLFDRVVRCKKRMPRVIYFSSSAVYPLELQVRNCHCSLSEELQGFKTNRIGRPDMTYGWAKLSGEYLAGFAQQKYGLDVKIYRPFGGYGEDQSFDYPFPSIIRRVLNGDNPIEVWGSGDQKRDFIHIDDVVDGVLSTMDQLPPGDVLNLGTGKGVSFRELAELASNLLGRHAKVRALPDKPEGVFARVADTHKLDSLGFSPKISLPNGLLRVANHIKKQLTAGKI